MYLIKPSFEILDFNCSPELIEKAGRTCYKSECKGEPEKFVEMICKRQHHSVIEHGIITVKFIVSRSFSHELVRHRLCSFSQESTRYVKSTNDRKITLNEEIIELYTIDGLSMKKIANKLGLTETNILSILKNNNIKRRNLGCTGITHHDYFDNIDSHEKAYLLGMIMADGCVRTTHNSLTITQHKEVGWYLYLMLRNFIRPNIKPIKDKNCFGYNVISEQIVNSLINKGIIPNKSYNFGKKEAELLWGCLSDEFIPSFLRGYLDGDGNIRFFKQNNKGKTFSCNIGWSGPNELLYYIQKWISDNYNYTPNIIKVKDTKYLYRMCITNPEIGKLLCSKMLENFKFPYGNPNKTTRMAEHIDHTINFAKWGSEKFNIIIPPWLDLQASSWIWMESMDKAEQNYNQLIKNGWQPQQARTVLPQSLKTEIICSANPREWQHILKLRTDKSADPQMRQIMIPLLKEFQERCSVIFNQVQIKD